MCIDSCYIGYVPAMYIYTHNTASADVFLDVYIRDKSIPTIPTPEKKINKCVENRRAISKVEKLRMSVYKGKTCKWYTEENTLVCYKEHVLGTLLSVTEKS